MVDKLKFGYGNWISDQFKPNIDLNWVKYRSSFFRSKKPDPILPTFTSRDGCCCAYCIINIVNLI